jgi:hypothetical protein
MEVSAMGDGRGRRGRLCGRRHVHEERMRSTSTTTTLFGEPRRVLTSLMANILTRNSINASSHVCSLVCRLISSHTAVIGDVKLSKTSSEPSSSV